MKRSILLISLLFLVLLGGCRKADPLPGATATLASAEDVTLLVTGIATTATLLPSSTPFPTATRMPSLTPLPPGS
ncbi:MAG: hypothetical protein HGA28_06305, partial [Anaerolineaceae bacterium]|nr:hypothetical protein [Anaerolineaceae bacterium]